MAFVPAGGILYWLHSTGQNTGHRVTKKYMDKKYPSLDTYLSKSVFFEGKTERTLNTTTTVTTLTTWTILTTQTTPTTLTTITTLTTLTT